MNPIKKTSAKIAFLLLAMTILISSATFIDDRILTYVPVITFIAIAMIGFTEVGLKQLTPLSNLKRLGVMEWITLIVSFMVLISALIALPFVPLQIPTLTAMAGIIGILASIVLGVQAFI